MNPRLLQQWLELNPGPWPPSHYQLLGLDNGEGSADEIEMRVLQRMEKLRNYQLLYPDLVTEGMNRLAQCLNTLTDPDARQQYNQTLGVKAAPARTVTPPVPSTVLPNVLPDEIPLPLIPELEEDDSPRRGRRMESAFRERAPAPTINPSKPTRRRSRKAEADFLDDPGVEEDEPLVLEAIPKERKRKIPKLPPLVLPPELTTPREATKPPRETRPIESKGSARTAALRNQVRELVRVRKVLRIWEQIRQSLAGLDRETEEPLSMVNLLVAFQELIPALPQIGHVIGRSDEPGFVVATLARKAAPLEAIRGMSPSQRESLSQDCRAAHYRLSEAYRTQRMSLRKRRERGLFRAEVLPRLQSFFGEPFWLALGLGSVALLIAAVRS